MNNSLAKGEVALQSFSHVRLCDPMNCSNPGFSLLHCLLEFTQTHVHWVNDPSNHLILCLPLLHLSSIFSSIRVFSNKSALHIRWLKDWSFSISLSNEYSRLISFRINRFDLLAVQGTLKSLLQYYSLKASLLWCLAFFVVQLSHTYMTTGKTIALTTWTLASKWRCRSNTWVRKSPWRWKWQSIPVFLPEKSHIQRSLVSYSPWGCKRVRHDWSPMHSLNIVNE